MTYVAFWLESGPSGTVRKRRLLEIDDAESTSPTQRAAAAFGVPVSDIHVMPLELLYASLRQSLSMGSRYGVPYSSKELEYSRVV